MAPSVVEVVTRVMATEYGNPNSTHRLGVMARYSIEKARRSIARLLGTGDPESLVFTGGGSEADNLALRGVAFAARNSERGNHMITSAAEHKAVLDTAKALRDDHGFELTILPVDEFGRPRTADLRAALRSDTVLVSLMWANNETGAISPVAEFAEIIAAHRTARFHCDAIQAVGKLPVDLGALPIDLLSLSAHKFHGPKGIGALYARPELDLQPLVTGGGQESGRRAGTENTAAVAGMAEALKLAAGEAEETGARLRGFREALWRGIAGACPSAVRNSPKEDCLPGTLHVSVPGVDSRKLVAALDKRGYACSSGSACTSTGTEASHVLLAMGANEERAAGSLRISLGSTNSEVEVMRFPEALSAAVSELLAD